MKNIKCITIYPEVYHNQNLTPNDKIYLSVIRYYTLEGRTHCCKFSDQEMSEELLIGVRQIQNIKSKLKKLGLITIGEKGIKYVSQNNDIKPLNNDAMSQNNDIKPLNNDAMSQNNDIKPLNNDAMSQNNGQMSQNNDTNPCNSNENQQVAEVNKENKENKEKNKEENKDNKDQNESLDDYLSSWADNALREKEDNYKREKEEKDKNYCSVVDMVESLPVKEDTPTQKPSLNQTPIPTPISIVERMISTIDYWIQTEIVNNNSLNQSTKERLLKDNAYNKIQLTKYLSDYIENKDLNKMNSNKQFFENITQNAFKGYKLSINNVIRKESLSKKNPFSDLENSNGYKETNRWMNK